MKNKQPSYHFPAGYSVLQTAVVSAEFLKHPIAFVAKSLEKFSGTYSSAVSLKNKLIVTQHPGFISYILKDNNKNYQKSAFSDRAAAFFGKGLLYSNGDYWLKQRRLIQPGFHKEKIHGLYDNIIRTIQDFVAVFPVGERVDVYPLVHQLSFNVLIKSLFDIDLSPQVMDELKDIFSQLQDFLLKDINQPWRKLFYPLNGIQKLHVSKAKRLREIIVAIIRQRQSSNKDYTDLLDMLLNSKYEDTCEPMTEDQIIDELLILILAGHETTGNTISWLLYLLAANDDKRQQLLASLEHNSIYESLNNEYLKAAINEGMRLYPAAWMTDRVALEDDQFESFSFPKNTIIIPFFYGLHRDKNLWDEALTFKPERFMPDAKAGKPKNFFPFGAGPRMCIGNNFAMAEMSFFLYTFLRSFQIAATPNIPEMKPLMTLRPDNVFLNIISTRCS